MISCKFYRDDRMIQYANKISLCAITLSFSKFNPYHLYRNHTKGDILDSELTSRGAAIAVRMSQKNP